MIGSYLFLLGAGIGCALEILVLVVQNACPASQVGTATAAYSFFREIGVAAGRGRDHLHESPTHSPG